MNNILEDPHSFFLEKTGFWGFEPLDSLEWINVRWLPDRVVSSELSNKRMEI